MYLVVLDCDILYVQDIIIVDMSAFRGVVITHVQ